jgi:chromosome partitioning protein
LIRLVISNQRGGVGKTTTVVTLARCFAERGLKVLLLDTDSQGSVTSVLNLKPEPGCNLHGLLIKNLRFSECVTPAHPRIDVVCSDRSTMEAEAMLIGQSFREYVLQKALQGHDEQYDVILIDVAPSVTLFQTCAMIYARKVLVPVDMDMLSFQGALASLETTSFLRQSVPNGTDIGVLGILPTKVDRRLAMTDTVMGALEQIRGRCEHGLLPAVRTDQAVFKAVRSRKFLHDFDPRSKAVEDYMSVADSIFDIFEQKGPLTSNAEAPA